MKCYMEKILITKNNDVLQSQRTSKTSKTSPKTLKGLKAGLQTDLIRGKWFNIL